jgi:hypothetical protein
VPQSGCGKTLKCVPCDDTGASDAFASSRTTSTTIRRRAHGWDLSGSHWQTFQAFEDGEALFESVRLAKLEGIVAKKLSQPYRPGERLWVNVKNRDY